MTGNKGAAAKEPQAEKEAAPKAAKAKAGAKASPAVEVAKRQAEGAVGVVTLSTGVRARLVPVATATLEEAQRLIEDPQPPMWHNEKKGRDEPNYNDPGYILARAEAERERGLAMMDVLVLFGVELEDGVPPDEEWMPKLRLMEKRGRVDLSPYDLGEPVEREFVFKRFIAVTAADYEQLGEMCGLSPGGVAQAGESFPGEEARPAD